jgi:hypothetical protein
MIYAARHDAPTGAAEMPTPGDTFAGRWFKNLVNVMIGDPAS